MKLKVVVCDQLVNVRDGLRSELEAEPDINVATATASGIRALMPVRTERPDVILTGLNLEGLSGLESINRQPHENLGQPPWTSVGLDARRIVVAALAVLPVVSLLAWLRSRRNRLNSRQP